MTEILTIHPLAGSSSPSPASRRQAQAPDIVNDGFLSSFQDVLDIVNPLQHIPIVSSLYRSLTDSPISTGARIAGGALFGGPMGLLSALIDNVVESHSGKDIGRHLLAAANGEGGAEKLAEAHEYIPSGQRAAINSYVRAGSLLG